MYEVHLPSPDVTVMSHWRYILLYLISVVVLSSDLDPYHYQQIRITPFMASGDPPIDPLTKERVEVIVGRAITFISQILQVYPIDGPLKLSRSQDACDREHLGDLNDPKCARISPAYDGEKCVDGYKIPDDHLKGLYVWPEVDSDPEVIYPEGPGLPDTDLVLYIKAEHKAACDRGRIIAYSAYCKLDQSNRPIAGIINFCPGFLEDEHYDEMESIVVSIHEMFHILGFSQSLFDKFQQCSINDNGLVCEPRGEVISKDAEGHPRLYTPAVSLAAQNHWNCSQKNIGVPLENRGQDRPSSHWESRVMLGSLMTPVIAKPHLTFLDAITLSVFEDSGWYRVNYSYAQDLPWGRGKGCGFSYLDSCTQDTTHFCTNDSMIGCHYLHGDTAQCTTDVHLDGCNVFKPVQRCRKTSAADLTDLSQTSMCFLSNLQSETDDFSGECYPTRCNSSNYEIKVNSSGRWVPCPPGRTINVHGYDRSIQCPPAEVICRKHPSIVDLIESLPSNNIPILPSSTNRDPVNADIFEVYFNLPHLDADNRQVQSSFLSSLCQLILIDRSQVEITEMDLGEGVIYFSFINTTKQEVHSYTRVLTSAVQNKQFVWHYQNKSFIAYKIHVSHHPSSPESVTIAMTTSPTPRVVPRLRPVVAVLSGLRPAVTVCLIFLVLFVVALSTLTISWAIKVLKRQAIVTPIQANDTSVSYRPRVNLYMMS